MGISLPAEDLLAEGLCSIEFFSEGNGYNSSYARHERVWGSKDRAPLILNPPSYRLDRLDCRSELLGKK